MERADTYLAAVGYALSALPPKADMRDLSRLVRFVPFATWRTAANGILLDYCVVDGERAGRDRNAMACDTARRH